MLVMGMMLAIVWIWREDVKSRLALFEELAKVKSDFADTVSKAADANNAHVMQLVAIADKVQMHEMAIKGAGEKR